MEIIQPSSRSQWRCWLEANHASSRGVELVYAKKKSGLPSLSYQEALEEALCFGWIDSTIRSIDERLYKQVFTPRKAKSMWSKVNRNLAACLESEGLMSQAGFEAVRRAQENGCWDFFADCESHIIPGDLASALDTLQKKCFGSLTPSQKERVLRHLKKAQREDTRRKRIEEICAFLSSDTPRGSLTSWGRV